MIEDIDDKVFELKQLAELENRLKYGNGHFVTQVVLTNDELLAILNRVEVLTETLHAIESLHPVGSYRLYGDLGGFIAGCTVCNTYDGCATRTAIEGVVDLD